MWLGCLKIYKREVANLELEHSISVLRMKELKGREKQEERRMNHVDQKIYNSCSQKVNFMTFGSCLSYYIKILHIMILRSR